MKNIKNELTYPAYSVSIQLEKILPRAFVKMRYLLSQVFNNYPDVRRFTFVLLTAMIKIVRIRKYRNSLR